MHGTLQLAIGGPSRVIVCADSRTVSYKDNATLTDDSQKLFQCGARTVCGILGCTNDKINHRIAWICADPNWQDMPGEIVARIVTELRAPLTDALVANPDASDDSFFSAFCIRRQASGKIHLVRCFFPLSKDADGNRVLGSAVINTPMTPDNFTYSLGYRHCLTKNLESQLNVGLSDAVLLRDIDYIFETARRESTDCAEGVGGPIDVASIDADGFRWLRKKATVKTRPTRLQLFFARISGSWERLKYRLPPF